MDYYITTQNGAVIDGGYPDGLAAAIALRHYKHTDEPLCTSSFYTLTKRDKIYPGGKKGESAIQDDIDKNRARLVETMQFFKRFDELTATQQAHLLTIGTYIRSQGLYPVAITETNSHKFIYEIEPDGETIETCWRIER